MDSEKLLVGSISNLFNNDIFIVVPVVLYFSVLSPRLFLDKFFLISLIFFGSDIEMFISPPTAIALIFFDPITAPTPVLAAILPPSFFIPANLTKFSPAGPIVA